MLRSMKQKGYALREKQTTTVGRDVYLEVKQNPKALCYAKKTKIVV